MDIRKLQRAIVDGLEDVKAQNIAVFNTEHLSPLFERVIIASGTSNRQTKALASSVRETVKKRGMDVLRTEGEDNGEWIIVDCGAAVAHIMQPAIREYYHLEELWGGKNVKLKFGDKATGLVKASEPQAPARTSAPKKAAAKKAPSKQATAQKDANRTAAFKRVAAKSPARKALTTPAPPSAGRTAAKPATAAARGAGKAPAKAAPAKAPARKAAPAKAAPRRARTGKA